jgi:hypothetical protein
MGYAGVAGTSFGMSVSLDLMRVVASAAIAASMAEAGERCNRSGQMRAAAICRAKRIRAE